MGAEAKFGILIEGQDRATPAFDQAIRKDEELIRTVERLIAVSERTAQSTQFVTDILKYAAEETARLSEEQKRLADETAKAETASKRAAEAAQAEAAARKLQREETFEWAFAIAAVGSALVAASDRAGNFQEHVELIRQITGLTAREQGALAVAASNVGRSYEQAAPAIDIFVRRLGEARKAQSEGQKTPSFDATGIVGGLDRSTGAILQEIGEKLNAMTDPAERARIAVELFGRSWETVLPIITQSLEAMGDQAERSGLVLSGALEKTATDADVQGDRIKAALAGVTLQLAAGLAGHGGNSIKEFIAGAAEGFAEFLTWINKSNEELGHFQINLTNTKFPKGVSFKAGGGFKDFLEGNIIGDAYTKQGPMFNQPPMPSDKFFLDQQEATRKAILAEKAAGDAAKELAEAKKAWSDAAALEASVDPFVFSPTKNRAGLVPNKGTGAVGGRAEGGTLTVDDEIFSSFDKFMSRFEDAVPILEATADAAGNVNERAAAFTATLLEQEPAWRKGQKDAEDFQRRISALGDTLKGGVSDAISDLILHTGNLEDALNKLLDSIVRQYVKMAVGFLLAPIGLQQGGTFLQSGGSFAGASQSPFHAQSGVVVSGVRGADTHMGMFGRGEAVLDHGLTDNLAALARDLRNGTLGAQGGRNVTVIVPEGAIQYHGVFANVRELEQASSDYIFPMFIDWLRRGVPA